MTIRKKFADLHHKSSPGQRATARREGAHVAKSNAIGQLRSTTSVSQVELAKRLGVQQSTVSRTEAQLDPQLSTLVRYFEALGARLELTAILDDGERLTFDHPAGREADDVAVPAQARSTVSGAVGESNTGVVKG